jgi:DHA1 family multidrug resistance protein-like MFS transporter
VADVAQAALVTGVMLAISPLLAAFFSPLWGLLADRYGRKRMVQRSLLVFAVACALMGRVTDVAQLFLLRACIGVFGGFTSMTMAYVVTVAPASRAGGALGLLQAAQVGGIIVGPICAGLIADRFGLRATFAGGSAVILVGLAAATLLTQDDRRLVARPAAPAPGAAGPRPGARAGLGELRAAARLPGLLAVMAVLFLVQFVDRSFGPILPLYVEQLGAPPEAVASYSGTIISLAAVGTGISASLLGHLSSRLPARRLLLGTLIAGAALCLPLALVRNPLQLLAVRVLLGLFAGGSLTLAYALANQTAPTEGKGAAFGVLSSVSLLGSASSPLVTGALAGIGLRSVFVLDSALYLVAFLWAARSPSLPAPQPMLVRVQDGGSLAGKDSSDVRSTTSRTPAGSP